VANTVTQWLEVGGNSIESVGEHVYVCGPEGLTKLHKTTATRVWEGACDGLALGATIWLQSGDELIGLGWTGYQETHRIPLPPGYEWSLAGDRLVQWRSEPAELRVQGPAGVVTISPDHSVSSLVDGVGDLQWLGDEGTLLGDANLGVVTLDPPADRLIALDWEGVSYAAVYSESRAIGLLDRQGKGSVLLPTMVRPEQVVAGDFDRDGCIDFVVVGDEAAWVQTRCEAVAVAPAPSPISAGLILTDEWITRDLAQGESVELRIEAAAGGILSLDGLPAGLEFVSGLLTGTPENPGIYTVTAVISEEGGGVRAAGFSLRVVGDSPLEAATYATAAAPKQPNKTDCVMGLGIMMGWASARTDWFNLTGAPTVFGSPTVSLLCGRASEKKLTFVYGADSSPTALISAGQLKLLMGTAGVHIGTPRVGAGLFASLGLLSVATGVRLIWMPKETKREMPYGLELRAAWLAATPDAGEFSVSYSWQLGKRSPKIKR
jgi:hypothetical protein